jgi:hypothetical protein
MRQRPKGPSETACPRRFTSTSTIDTRTPWSSLSRRSKTSPVSRYRTWRTWATPGGRHRIRILRAPASQTRGYRPTGPLGPIWGLGPSPSSAHDWAERREALSIPQSCSTTLSKERLILNGSSPLYSMKPSFLNFFRKKFTRERVVPAISASVSCEILATTRAGRSCFP